MLNFARKLQKKEIFFFLIKKKNNNLNTALTVLYTLRWLLKSSVELHYVIMDDISDLKYFVGEKNRIDMLGYSWDTTIHFSIVINIARGVIIPAINF